VAALKGNPELAAAIEAVERAEAELAPLEREVRGLRLERLEIEEHIRVEEGKLYGGKVKAPKELENLQLEVDSLKRRLSGVEDTALDRMMARDAAAEALTRAQSALEEVEQRTAAEQASLLERKAKLAAVQRALDNRWERAAAPVRAADLALYDRLRKRKGGRAVAELAGENCGACGMRLPRQDRQRARTSDEIVQCPGCARVLCG
jgi:predicted  nucleic acid-binding Zn-ribbon protein